jgi:hypothetical protein
VCLGRGRGDSIIVALADVRGRKLAERGALPVESRFRVQVHRVRFRERVFTFRASGQTARERRRPQFQTRPVSHRAKKVLLKFARSSNRRIPHVERSAFKGVERGHHLASSDEFSRFFARAPIGRAGRSITQAREKKGFNPKGRLKKRLSRRARALPSAPVSARVARPERRLRRAPEDPHRPDPGETPRLERGRGTWRPRCRARCPRTRLR